MAKASHEVLRELIAVNTRLAEIVADLNPGKNMSDIANSLAKTRERCASIIENMFEGPFITPAVKSFITGEIRQTNPRKLRP